MARRLVVESNVPSGTKRIGWPFTVLGLLLLVFVFDTPWYAALGAAFLTSFYIDVEYKR